MVINVSNVCDIGTEAGNHIAEAVPGLPRIERVSGQLDLRKRAARGVLEIPARNEMPVVSRGLATRIGHGEKGCFMAVSSYQIHDLEQVDFGAAEREIIFVAIENSHEGLPWRPRYALRARRRTWPNFSPG